MNNIESIISKQLIDNKISHEDFTKNFNEERNSRELKENIRTMKSQKTNTEKIICLMRAKD